MRSLHFSMHRTLLHHVLYHDACTVAGILSGVAVGIVAGALAVIVADFVAGAVAYILAGVIVGFVSYKHS